MSESRRIDRLLERLAMRDNLIESLNRDIEKKNREIERLKRGRDSDIAKHIVLLDQICELKREMGMS